MPPVNDSPPETVPLLDLSEVLDALSDETRRRILLRLMGADFCCSSFQDLGPKTRLTYHFARLQHSGLIRVTKSGRRRILSLRGEEVEDRFPGVLRSVLESMTDADAAPTREARPATEI
ncbi:MAG: helix-turn-helix transcriptional regulator [Fibrella sp.]|nr:helix-turn-helix transcriptional regulator [Armatimonadota bacterium]